MSVPVARVAVVAAPVTELARDVSKSATALGIVIAPKVSWYFLSSWRTNPPATNPARFMNVRVMSSFFR